MKCTPQPSRASIPTSRRAAVACSSGVPTAMDRSFFTDELGMTALPRLLQATSAGASPAISSSTPLRRSSIALGEAAGAVPRADPLTGERGVIDETHLVEARQHRRSSLVGDAPALQRLRQLVAGAGALGEQPQADLPRHPGGIRHRSRPAPSRRRGRRGPAGERTVMRARAPARRPAPARGPAHDRERSGTVAPHRRAPARRARPDVRRPSARRSRAGEPHAGRSDACPPCGQHRCRSSGRSRDRGRPTGAFGGSIPTGARQLGRRHRGGQRPRPPLRSPPRPPPPPTVWPGRRARRARPSHRFGSGEPGQRRHLGLVELAGLWSWTGRRRERSPAGISIAPVRSRPVPARAHAAASTCGPMPSFSLIRFSISSARSGLSRRNLRAFSLPCPSWSPS